MKGLCGGCWSGCLWGLGSLVLVRVRFLCGAGELSDSLLRGLFGLGARACVY